MSYLYNYGRTLGGGSHEADDRGGTILPGETSVAGNVSRVRNTLVGGVGGGTSTFPAWDEYWTLVGGYPTPPHTPGYTGSTSLGWLGQ